MDIPALLHSTTHRPWPLPAEPWIMTQCWHDLLFIHWPIEQSSLYKLLPPQLSLDTFAGQYWLGIVPFRMSHVTPRGLPPLPWISAFPELNVRTYVTVNGIAGVYFFSLDAANQIAVALARRFFHLPYFYAHMSCLRDGDTIHYSSSRRYHTHHDAKFVANYRPIGPPVHPQPGTLEHWLTERYCLYTVTNQHVLRCDIHHRPWSLQAAELELQSTTMSIAAGIQLPDTQPLLHYSHLQEVLAWPLRHIC
jgi:uncharacterized protein YqjF (DUF2071 family)